jgi:hypothetical protein
VAVSTGSTAYYRDDLFTARAIPPTGGMARTGRKAELFA